MVADAFANFSICGIPYHVSGDACPIFPGKRYEDWVLDDPAGLAVEQVRPVRDEIERRVRRLLDELGVPATR